MSQRLRNLLLYPCVFISNGNGTFKARTSYAVPGGQPQDITIADLNGDNIKDIVYSAEGSPSIGVFLGNGNGTFGAATTVATGGVQYYLRVADINGDGRNDIVTSDYASTTNRVFLSAVTATTTTVTTDVDINDIDLTTYDSAANSYAITSTLYSSVTNVKRHADSIDNNLVGDGNFAFSNARTKEASAEIYTAVDKTDSATRLALIDALRPIQQQAYADLLNSNSSDVHLIDAATLSTSRKA